MALDSGSEEEDDFDELTLEQLQEILEDDGDNEEAPQPDTPGNFIWTDNYNVFTGVREQFQEEVGSKIDGISPSEIFCQLWDQPLLEKIVEETNRYAWQSIVQATESETGISSQSRVNDWVETSVSELYRLFAVMILMGICVLGRIDEYWSTGILGMPGFRSIMSKNRFMLLMKFLHFKDNYTISVQGDQKK